MKTVALITARGGSKGIPGKNLAPVHGKPLIAWTIEVAISSKAFSRIIVSTDDEEIAAVSRRWGAEVPFLRPAELARDDSPHVPVLIHAVEALQRQGETGVTHLFLLQPTSPLRIPEDIHGAIRLGTEMKADSIIGVSRMAMHPYLAKRVTADGRLEPYLEGSPVPERRQDPIPAYAPNGSLYLVRTEVLCERKTLYTDRTYAYMVPEERALDVDTPWDLQLAGMILRAREGHGPH